MGARTMGMILTRNDSRAIMHLIRYAGCIIGIEEAFLPQTEREGQLMLYRILLSVVGEPGEAGRTLAAALADEPLGRRYRAFQRLRRRFARERNLSVNVFFLGLAGMRNLGLPHRYILGFRCWQCPITRRVPLPIASPPNASRRAGGARNANGCVRSRARQGTALVKRQQRSWRPFEIKHANDPTNRYANSTQIRSR